MSQTFSIAEVARRLVEHNNRAAHCDECFVLVRANKPISELHRHSVGKRLAELPAPLESLAHHSAPAATPLAKHLRAVREGLARAEVHDR
jgi:hypothetical protein